MEKEVKKINSRNQRKILGKFIAFMLIVLILIVSLKLKYYFYLSGIYMDLDLLGIIGVIIFLGIIIGTLSKELIKINNYFIIAVILSLIVILIGVSFLSQLYHIETDISAIPTKYNAGDYKKLIGNGSEKILFYKIICSSTEEEKYLVKNDIFICNITSTSTKKYNQTWIEVTKYLTNDSFENTGQQICKENPCQIYLFLKDNARGFQLIPIYESNYDQSEKIRPLSYWIEIKNLRNKGELEDIEYEKMSFLLAIITAALISVWGSIYYAKKILEENNKGK